MARSSLRPLLGHTQLAFSATDEALPRHAMKQTVLLALSFSALCASETSVMSYVSCD